MAKIITKGIGLNPAAELEEWRRILAMFGKKLPKSRYKIINGHVHYNGTIDCLTLCWNEDLLIARKKSSLTGDRFNKEQCFEGSRRSAERFAEGNRLASKLYALVDEEKKAYSLFCFLKKKAILLIKEGKSITEAEECLMDYLKDFKLLTAGVETCQRHVRTDHQGEDALEEPGVTNIIRKVFPGENILPHYNAMAIFSDSINDTG